MEKTRNANTMSEAAFWGMIRSTLRRRTMYWKPISIAKSKARRPYKGNNTKQKWEYQCAKCKKWWKDKEVEVNHVKEAGSLKCAQDLPNFVENLFAESGYEVLCKTCHKQHTNDTRRNTKT